MDKHDHHTDCALGLVGRVAPRRVRGGSFADPPPPRRIALIVRGE